MQEFESNVKSIVRKFYPKFIDIWTIASEYKLYCFSQSEKEPSLNIQHLNLTKTFTDELILKAISCENFRKPKEIVQCHRQSLRFHIINQNRFPEHNETKLPRYFKLRSFSGCNHS